MLVNFGSIMTLLAVAAVFVSGAAVGSPGHYKQTTRSQIVDRATRPRALRPRASA